MDSQPARQLSSVLSQIDRYLAESAIQPLDRLLERADAGFSLIVALIGPSGVGKSTLMNEIAGDRIVAVGPLRPTTTSIAVWGDIADIYLAGNHIGEPKPPGDIVLVDTPAAEHYPDAVADVLDHADVAILVVSPDRYADAVTAATMSTAYSRGIPTRIVLSIDPSEHIDQSAVADDVAETLGAPVDAILSRDATAVLELLETLSEDRDDLIGQRDRGAAAFCAVRARDVARRFAERSAEAETVVFRAEALFDSATVDPGQLAAVTVGEWQQAAGDIVAMLRAATDDVIDELATEVSDDPIAAEAVRAAGVSLPAVDRQPIDDWYGTITGDAVGSVRHRHLHPLRWRAVRDDMWRLSIDFEQRPSTRFRKALGDKIPDLRIDSRAALTVALAAAVRDRTSTFVARLDPYAVVTPEDIVAAADALAEEGSAPGTDRSADE